MSTTTQTIETLNDLVEIHNDRIAGYEKALKELKDQDVDLNAIFLTCIDQSRRMKLALGTEIQTLNGDIESGTTTSGKLYRAWMDIKAAFQAHSTHSVLQNTEFGEDAAQKAYEQALEEESLPAYLKELIAKQQIELQSAHDEIKTLRDQAVV